MSDRTMLIQKQRAETLARLTAPSHIVTNRFTEHEHVEGYEESLQAEGTHSSDRLYKEQNLYGTIQLGYNPRKGQSFLFAAIRTSIFDHAASRDQQSMSESQQMSQLKTGNQNRVFSARRKKDSAVLLYKAENKPWSEGSVGPYLRRVNLEALTKTMPFLNAREERVDRENLLEQQKSSEHPILDSDREKQRAAFRARQMTLSRDLDTVGSLIWRKDQQTRLFFRRINLAFDLQKMKMFEYYRERVERSTVEAESAVLPPDDQKDKDDT